MTTVREMLTYAWLAEAAYTLFRSPIARESALEDLQNSLLEGEFSPSQAERLLAVPSPAAVGPLGCRIRHQIDASAPGQSGFSATLVEDTASGRFILAIRGTEFPRDIMQDVVDADVSGLALGGIAGSQFADLLIYIRQLSASGGQAVTFSDVEVRQLARLRNTDTYYDPRWETYLPRPIEELRAQFAGIVGIWETVSGTLSLWHGRGNCIPSRSVGRSYCDEATQLCFDARLESIRSQRPLLLDV